MNLDVGCLIEDFFSLSLWLSETDLPSMDHRYWITDLTVNGQFLFPYFHSRDCPLFVRLRHWGVYFDILFSRLKDGFVGNLKRCYLQINFL